MGNQLTVVVVDPDPAITDALTTLLSSFDVEVRVFPDGKTFLNRTSPTQLGDTCIMIEAALPDMSAQSLLREIRARGSLSPVVILSNGVGIEMRRQAIEFGATDVIEKSLIHDYLFGH